MKFTQYGYTEERQKHYSMTIGDLKISLMQQIVENEMTEMKIKLVEMKCGEVETFKNMKEFLLEDLNNSFEIKLIDFHIVHMNDTDEDVIVICFKEVDFE